MGRRYSISGTQNVASPDDSVLGVTATTAVRPAIYDLLIGCHDTPGDIALLWSIQRYTAAGTATAVTPAVLDPGDPASTATAGQNHTVEPTYTSATVVWQLPLNQRASHRWVADPMGYLKCPATNSNGLGVYPTHASATVLVGATVHFEE